MTTAVIKKMRRVGVRKIGRFSRSRESSVLTISTNHTYIIMDFNKSHLAPEGTIRFTAEEALGELAETLSSSNAARDRFIVAVGQLEDQFERDIAEFDAEIASIPPSLAHLLKSKELKRKERFDQRNSRKRLGLGDDVVSIASSSRASQRSPPPLRSSLSGPGRQICSRRRR